MKNTFTSAKSLLCPISPLRVGESTVRLTGLLVAALIMLYVLTGAGVIMLVLAIDYRVRAGTRWPSSPLSWLAARLVRALHLPNRPIDKAPKLFAARVGLLFALASGILTLLHQHKRIPIPFVASECQRDQNGRGYGEADHIGLEGGQSQADERGSTTVDRNSKE